MEFLETNDGIYHKFIAKNQIHFKLAYVFYQLENYGEAEKSCIKA